MIIILTNVQLGRKNSWNLPNSDSHVEKATQLMLCYYWYRTISEWLKTRNWEQDSKKTSEKFTLICQCLPFERIQNVKPFSATMLFRNCAGYTGMFLPCFVKNWPSPDLFLSMFLEKVSARQLEIYWEVRICLLFVGAP